MAGSWNQSPGVRSRLIPDQRYEVTDSKVDVVEVQAPRRAEGLAHRRAGVTRYVGPVDLQPRRPATALTSPRVQVGVGGPRGRCARYRLVERPERTGELAGRCVRLECSR